MRNDPVGYHVSVSCETGTWRGKVTAFNRTDAVFRAGMAAGSEGLLIGRYAIYYVHQDKGLGCCQPKGHPMSNDEHDNRQTDNEMLAKLASPAGMDHDVEIDAEGSVVIFTIDTPVGATRIKLGGATVQFVQAAHVNPDGFLYRGRRYVGQVLLTNPGYESARNGVTTDYRPPYNYGYTLARAAEPGAGGSVAQSTYMTIGGLIAEALVAYLVDKPETLGYADRASKLGQAAMLASEIEETGVRLAGMRKEYDRLMTEITGE